MTTTIKQKHFSTIVVARQDVTTKITQYRNGEDRVPEKIIIEDDHLPSLVSALMPGEPKDKEAIIDKYFQCTCHEIYKSREMADPSCVYCSEYGVLSAMLDEYSPCVCTSGGQAENCNRKCAHGQEVGPSEGTLQGDLWQALKKLEAGHYGSARNLIERYLSTGSHLGEPLKEGESAKEYAEKRWPPQPGKHWIRTLRNARVDAFEEGADWARCAHSGLLDSSNEWVSVETGLPPLDEYVLVYGCCGMYVDPDVHCAMNHRKRGWRSNGSYVTEITHWRPLPAPPSEKPNLPTDPENTYCPSCHNDFSSKEYGPFCSQACFEQGPVNQE